MDNDKAIRAAKLTLGGLLEKKRAKTAVERAQGQIAPSKYLPGVPRQVHADGGKVADSYPFMQHLQKASDDMGHGFHFEEGGCLGMAHALAEEIGGRIAASKSGFKHYYAEKNGSLYDYTGKTQDKAGHRIVSLPDAMREISSSQDEHDADKASAREVIEEAKSRIPRQVHADGGEVAPDAPPPVDLGQVREQKQLQTFHTGMMGDVNTRMTQAMEAHQKAVDAGHFDGYEVGDVLQGSKTPMRITGRYVQQWKPTRATLDHFDRMGAKPTIIEHEGKQYIPMLRYQTGKEGEEGFQDGSAYLDGIKAAGYQKMGGLRVIKADGGSVSAKEKFLEGNHPEVPHVLYHATQRDFSTFKKGRSVQANFNNAQKNLGHFFTDDPVYAARYVAHPWGWGNYMENSNLMPVHLSMKNPKIEDISKIDEIESKWTYQQSAAYRKQLEDMGHDGIIFKGTAKTGPIKEFVAFHPHQIKSAIGNNGDFDPTNPDITKARGGAVGPEFEKWFAGSKVKHPDGRPMLMVHASPNSDIKAFRRNNSGGIWFSPAHDTSEADIVASDTGRGKLPNPNPDQHPDVGVGATYYPVHLAIKNPARGELAGDFYDGKETVQSLKRKGYDGVAYDDDVHVAFDPHQIKSPFNQGTFDPTKPDMTYADGGMVPAMSPQDVTARSAQGEEDPLLLIDQTLDNINNAGRLGSVAGKMTGVPLGGMIGRQIAENIAASRYNNYADGGAAGGYVPQKTQKAYKLFRTKGDGKLYPLFVHADKPVEMGKWLEAEEGPQGKEQGKVKSKLGDLAYRPGWHAGDLPIATHIGGKSSPDLKKPDYRPDNHVWAEVEMAADKDWQSEADSRGRGVKAHITDQVPLKGFYRYKTNPNMTGNWLIGGHMKVNRVLSDDEVKEINDRAGTADLPRLERTAKADGGSVAERSPMFEGMSEHLLDDEGKPMELWHGTPGQPFEAFDDSKIGVRDPGFFGRGHYLTPDRGVADAYADPDEMGRGSVMGPLHAALKNPYVWDVSDEQKSHSTLRDLQSMGIMKGQGKIRPWDNLQRHHIDPFMEEVQRRGHDGVIYKTDQGVKEIVVFKPTAIKHRDAEVGDPNDPRIMRADGGKVDLYSKAARVLGGLKDQPMQVEDIIKYALGKGVKRSEIDYTDPPRGGMARPSQVAQHIADTQPQIGVQRRGDAINEYKRMMEGDMMSYTRDDFRRLDELEREAMGDGNRPRYAQHQLPGGENYREHILTLDNHQGQTYTAPMHWSDTPNPLAHIRMSDRMIGNKKILHVEELQSDWSNDARKRGLLSGTEQQDYDNFVSQMRQKAIDKVNARTGETLFDQYTGEERPYQTPMVAQAQIEKYQNMDPYMLAMKLGMQEEHRKLVAATRNRVPRAPYINPDRDDASELAMKHVLTEAAKGGYDGISFTPDAAQSDRWKGTNFNGIYDRKLPSMAQRLVRQHDIQGGSTENPQSIGGYDAPHVELTDKARQGILQNGFSSFRRGGYVTHVRRMR